MGGRPLYCLVSLALADWTDQRWIDGFYRGVNKLLRQTKTQLAGGDISHAKQLVLRCHALRKRSAKGKLCGAAARSLAIAFMFPARSEAGATSGDIVPRLDIGRQADRKSDLLHGYQRWTRA